MDGNGRWYLTIVGDSSPRHSSGSGFYRFLLSNAGYLWPARNRAAYNVRSYSLVCILHTFRTCTRTWRQLLPNIVSNQTMAPRAVSELWQSGSRPCALRHVSGTTNLTKPYHGYEEGQRGEFRLHPSRFVRICNSVVPKKACLRPYEGVYDDPIHSSLMKLIIALALGSCLATMWDLQYHTLSQ